MYIVKVIICVFFLITGFSCGKAPSDSPVIRMALLKGPSAIAFSNLLDSVYCIQGKRFEIVLYGVNDTKKSRCGGLAAFFCCKFI